jgi:hypothetical protein
MHKLREFIYNPYSSFQSTQSTQVDQAFNRKPISVAPEPPICTFSPMLHAVVTAKHNVLRVTTTYQRSQKRFAITESHLASSSFKPYRIRGRKQKGNIKKHTTDIVCRWPPSAHELALGGLPLAGRPFSPSPEGPELTCKSRLCRFW